MLFTNNYEKRAKDYAYSSLLHEIFLLKQIIDSEFLTPDIAKRNEISGIIRNIEQNINLLTLSGR